MRIIWSTLWFLDYRIPVFKELSLIDDVDFYLVYNGVVNSERINQKVKEALGDRAILMTGEKRLGSDSVSGFANKGFRIPYQPGLIRKIKELNPDVIISDGFFQWKYAPLFLRATSGIPHVMCYERTKHTERNAQLIRRLYRKSVLRWIDIICCSGKLCGEYVEGLGFYKNNITFGHMVADVEALMKNIQNKGSDHGDNLKQKLGLENVVYLFVGRMIELKGVINLLKAWDDFTIGLKEKPSLLLVGSGEQDEAVKGEILAKGLDTVKFIGQINYDDIADYYKLADIFIIPTLEDNWSLVVSEAMACGLPVITSIYNGCWPELIQKSNGWVIDPLDHDDFVRVLIESYEHRNDIKKMGLASLEIIIKFTPATAAMSIYRSCQMAIGKRNV